MSEKVSTKSRKKTIDILLLVLAIICLLFFGLIGHVISLIVLFIYLISTENNYLIQKIIFFFGILGIILAIFGFILSNGMESRGIDAIGEAVIYAAMINIGRITAITSSLLILIIDNTKNISKNK